MTESVALVHADGALPNLALMRLSTYFRERGARVRLVRPGEPRTLHDQGARAFGSSIFGFSAKTRDLIEREWGPVTWGGTGVRVESSLSEVDPTVDWEAIAPDYSLYPDFDPSLGFTQRGCRLSCKFCVVPKKEGKPRAVHRIADIWRGPGHPRKILLLDNDFFGQPRAEWEARVEELRAGGFRVCLSQGINIRMIDFASARALASLEYRDNDFRRRRLYTAWDNLGDEEAFKRGVATLGDAGVPARHLRVYMLVGFRPDETLEEVLYRFNELVALGCEPYPMPFDQTRRDLKAFQRWAVTGLYRAVPWSAYDGRIKNKNKKVAR